MKVLILFFTFILSANLIAERTQFNHDSGKWETVPDGWKTKYNPHDNTWSFQPEDAKTVYNSKKGIWEWDTASKLAK